ncbi:MAG: hypothetical protein AMXMBFR83_23910 [Phycisphaerae bacterium]
MKIAVIVLALSAAGYFTWRSRAPGDEQADTPESAVPYVCANCGQVVRLTPADFDRIINTPRPGAARSEETRGRSQGLFCEKCNQAALFLGATCPKDGTIVPKLAQDGSAGRCPKCGWAVGS